MIFAKYRKDEAGYLLLESLITLMIVMVIIFSLMPLLTDWLVRHSQAKIAVEESRQLYEASMERNNRSIKGHLTTQESELEVVIYEIHFEYE